ncbi:MAG: succinate dehydrogenase, cytochrome b556 subunit [Anaerolineae bacterium]
MGAAIANVRRVLTYQGREGQWAWILHRASGLGVFAFLVIHIIDIYLIGYGPEPFDTLTAIYHHPVARVGHIFLFFGVLFHAINGARIIIFDFWPQLWRHQRRAIWIETVIFLLIFIPSTIAIIVSIFENL